MSSVHKMKSLLATIALAGALGLAFVATTPSIAHAECDENEDDDAKGGKNWHVEIRNGERVVVIDKKITVCGKVPRPAVVYVLQARTINYEWENLKQDFLPLILSAVSGVPF